MKLIRAQFQNFRMLRDLELEFSTDSDKKLTVIRAANESGKTTILHALQWALYGDEALPGGSEFRLHPIDWDANDGKQVAISVTVEFEVTKQRLRRGSSRVRSERQVYMLTRSTHEGIEETGKRSQSSVKLYAKNDTGMQLIANEKPLINEVLPKELREVFFTDGDRALSFIEATRNEKRKRVKDAIRSLLGLDIIETAIGHVSKTIRKLNSAAGNLSTNSELGNIATQLDEVLSTKDKQEEELQDIDQQMESIMGELDAIELKIQAALRKGNRDELNQEWQQVKEEINVLNEQIKDAERDHLGLFKGQALATGLLRNLLDQAHQRLEDLHTEGQIPNTTIPVLQHQLETELCICGENLNVGDPDGERRRLHIQDLIKESQKADEVQEILTGLFYGGKTQQASSEDGDANGWIGEYGRVVKRNDDLQNLREKAGEKSRRIELEIKELPDVDVRGLQEARDNYREAYDRLSSKRATVMQHIEELTGQQSELEHQKNKLLQNEEKGRQIIAEQEVVNDVKGILENSYKQITGEERNKVSHLMNALFLEMIGSDPDQGAMIQRAEISDDFDIIVYGPMDRTLNPERDLNGASRRALTLSFILALTKVSEVEAPNVIDTPLGMTSGYVKRSILDTTIRESSQSILFLTHAEINDCEEILDGVAGKIYTLTNPTHYPTMLINDPQTAERKILQCNCSHREECNICSRRTYEADEPSEEV